MPTFKLGECSVDLSVERLDGPLATADRQVAWRLYLELVARPALRDDAPAPDEIRALISAFRDLLAAWPAAQVETARPGQLGYLVLSIVQLVLVPCLQEGQASAQGWTATREFCRSLAAELARVYRFHDTTTALPADLRAAWRART